jgi:hypothetical protein
VPNKPALHLFLPGHSALAGKKKFIETYQRLYEKDPVSAGGWPQT